VVRKLIIRQTEQINRQIELVENRFKSINDEIECRIINVSRVLHESLNIIDSSLSNLLQDPKSVNKKYYYTITQNFSIR